jgi:mgtE-like transporter
LNAFFMASQLARYLIGVFCFSFFFIVFYVLIKNFRKKEFMKTIKEFFLTLVSVAFIVNITGLILSRISQIIGGRPTVYLVYPALIDTIGSVGSIVGSTATTKLALGFVDSSFSSIKRHLPEIGGAWVASLMLFTLYSGISSLAEGAFTLGNFLKLSAQLLSTNILAVFFMVLIVYAVAIYTYKRGWDPDNFVIPIESSLADGITTVSLLVMLILIV